MPNYITRDCHVKYHGEMIEPYTAVDVDDDDQASWEQLVAMHLADRAETGVPDELEEPAPLETSIDEPMPKAEMPSAVGEKPKPKGKSKKA